VRRTLRITEPVVRLATVLPAVLTAHVKLATLSLAGLIAVTFAGGLFVGMVVGKGQGRAEPPAAARIGGSEPLTATAPATPTPTVSHVVGVAPGAATGSPTPAAAAPAVTPSAVSGAATSAAAPVAPSEATVTPQPEAQPPEAARDSKAKKPGVALRPPRPRRPAVAGTATATDLPPAGGKLVVSKPTTATKPAVAASKPTVLASKPTAHSVVGPSTASKPMANNAAAKPAPKSKTKTTWHDPFAD
jgi:hypothetical protein